MLSNASVNGGEFRAHQISREDAPWHIMEIQSLAVHSNLAAGEEANRFLNAHYPVNEE
jgi:hypothetical protein